MNKLNHCYLTRCYKANLHLLETQEYSLNNYQESLNMSSREYMLIVVTNMKANTQHVILVSSKLDEICINLS